MLGHFVENLRRHVFHDALNHFPDRHITWIFMEELIIFRQLMLDGAAHMTCL
jgi:hypothetical protein